MNLTLMLMQNRGMLGGVDMNVFAAWELGYSGRGVVVTILDDGVEHNHTDLHQNYVSRQNACGWLSLSLYECNYSASMFIGG